METSTISDFAQATDSELVDANLVVISVAVLVPIYVSTDPKITP